MERRSGALDSGDAGKLEARLNDCFAAGRVAWPDVRLAAETFASHVTAVSTQIPPRHPADLYLACGCAHAVPGALEALETKLTAEVARSIARSCTSPTAVEEVLQELRASILVARDGRPPRIATYAGTARLSTWLTTAALRIARRTSRREKASERPDPLVEAVASPADPELELAKERYRPDVEQAIGDSLRELPPRDRAILRLHLVEGVTLERVGRLYGVSRATAARWIANARDAVLSATRQRLRVRLGLGAKELESLLQLVQSRLDLRISVVLAVDSTEDLRR